MIKSIIKKYAEKLVFHINYAKKLHSSLYRNDKGAYLKVKHIMKCIAKIKVYKGKNNFTKLCKNIRLRDIDLKCRFYYNIDIYKVLFTKNMKIENLTIDYSKILNNSLLDFKQQLNTNKKNEKFYQNEIKTIQGIEILLNRIVKKLTKQKININIIKNIENIKKEKNKGFYEALQRILFYNQLLWQTNHRLNGLGRLDIILNQYYQSDIQQGIITKEKAKELLKEFLLVLHNYYEFKSNTLIGDTGQIIELGGKNVNNIYECNELTYIFIDILKELNIPDPKILLRVSSNMPRDLMKKALECIQTGIGCPLFANDDIIIPKLIEFGYKKEDAYNYGTSACWEPYIIGKSLDQNNIGCLVFIQPFNTLLEEENLSKIDNIENLMTLYKKYLKAYVDDCVNKSKKIKWQEDTILSLFIGDCINKNEDISIGGAIYNHYGFTGVGLSNVVNAIMNINNLVFKNKEFTMEELNDIRKNNFDNNNDLIKKLKNQVQRYGTDDEEVICLTNDIIEYITKVLNQYENYLGGKYKFGLSAPSYITIGKKTIASFDGRKSGEPFGVHISCDSSNAYTELIQFASKLNYNENRFNGNVVDFFVSPNFINDNFEKFVDFLMLSTKIGFFEMQMNVVSSKTLIEARKNPNKFPNLIVRVWGFSSYFKDLPDEYKDYLIERALKSEGNS